MKKVFIGLCLLLTSCSLLPEARVFQKTVPVEQVSPVVTEAQRQGASYIKNKSATPGKDPVKTIADIHSVSIPLSTSLGEPKKLIDDKESVIESLQKALWLEQKKADDWKKFSQKYGGTQLEGTGIDLAAPGALLGVGTLAALTVFVPGTLSVALFVIRRLRLTLQNTVKSVSEYVAENPQEGAKLLARQSSNLDRAEKATISKVKKFIENAPPTT